MQIGNLCFMGEKILKLERYLRVDIYQLFVFSYVFEYTYIYIYVHSSIQISRWVGTYVLLLIVLFDT